MESPENPARRGDPDCMRQLPAILALLLLGCYSQEKAQRQHGKAVATYPEIGADYCARIYPPARDTIIKGDTVVEVQIIYEDTGSVIVDTVNNLDTVTITRTITKPTQTIVQRIYQTDTLYRENRAALDLCEKERREAVAALSVEQSRADKYKKRAALRGYILLGLILAAAVWLYYSLKNRKR
jgi:hypothetical protein